KEKTMNADVDNTLLGTDANGKQLTVGMAATVDPLSFLTTPGTVLTSAGRAILRRLQELPASRAAALGLDTAAITAYAQKAGINPAVCLKAEIERIEQLEKDKAILGGPFGPGGRPAGTA